MPPFSVSVSKSISEQKGRDMKCRQTVVQGIAGKSFDVCVIGGGVVGAACALDARLRGLTVALIEAGDFAGATSSSATKIIHGGVRYLEEAIKDVDPKEYHVVVRALHERVRMLDNAPHLTRKLEFLVPSYNWLNVAYLDIGLKIYDWLAGSARISPSKFVDREDTLKLMPGLKQEGLIGAVEYADGQFDDSRYNLALVETFDRNGGFALNYARVTSLNKDSAGKLSGAQVTDQLSKQSFSINAKVVVNATGPAADSVRRMAAPTIPHRMRLSKGAHVLFPMELFPTEPAMLIPKTDDGRVLFVVPWRGRLLVGTTETEVQPGDELYVTSGDVDFILGQLNKYLETPVTPNQIVAGFAGARPLVSSGEDESTKKIARDDVIEIEPASGLISIMGGKWTTHRAMAEDTINAVEKSLGKTPSECLTHHHVLYGSEGWSHDYWQELVKNYGVAPDVAHHLSAKFGVAAAGILNLAKADPVLGERIVYDHPMIRAEVVYAVREELAATIEDVLARRLGVQFYSWRTAREAGPAVGAILGAELAWSPEQTKVAGEAYVSHINRLLDLAGLPREISGAAAAKPAV
jgi:glycerol-3-phosphate dehydrogenase